MDFWATIKVSIKSLMKNKARTLLTMLGMIFGVGAVVAMVSIGEGARVSSMERYEKFGTNIIMVRGQSNRKGGRHRGWGTDPTLTVEDGWEIKKQAKYIQYFTPRIRTVAKAVYGNNNWSTAVIGGSADYQYVRDRGIQSGRFFSEGEVKSGARVAVIGTIIRDELFNTENPIGKIIRVKGVSFKVIGLMEPKGESGWGGSMDDEIIIPYTTAMQRISRVTKLRRLLFSATSRDVSSRAQQEIRDILRQRHRLGPDKDDDFVIRSQEDRIKSANEAMGTFTVFLAAIASVSLLVGGIGIMNIMLVSVTERIREIGIRMAIGAKRRDILMQFMIEAIILSIMGGFIGVMLGGVSAKIVARVANWKSLLSVKSVFVSMIFATFIGLFFGIYPAWKASKLDPIKALRKE